MNNKTIKTKPMSFHGRWNRLTIMFCTVVLLFYSPLDSHARKRGGFDGGGGDPLVNEFMAIAGKVSQAQENGWVDIGVSTNDLRLKLDEIYVSLEGHSPLLVFEPVKSVNCFGFSKLGCVDKNGVIHIAKDGWQTASWRDRLEVTIMELIMVHNKQNRYEVATQVAKLITSPVWDSRSLVKSVSRGAARNVLDECSLALVNAALGMTPYMAYPQFDLKISDGKPDPISLDYQDPQDPDTKNADSIRKQLLSVSLLNIDKAPRTFVSSRSSQQTLGRTALFKHRVGVYTLLHVADGGETGQSCRKSLRFTSYDLTPVQRDEKLKQVTSTSLLPTQVHLNPAPKNSPQWASTLIEDSLWRQPPGRNIGPDPLPPEVRKAPSYARPFFKPCIRESLNAALERAAHEATTDRHSRAKISIQKVYEFRDEQNPRNPSVVVNLTVTVDDWVELPYSFKFDVVPTRDTCHLKEIQNR